MPPRRRSSATLSRATIDAANTALQNLPEKPRENLSLKEAVAALKDTIITALNRGYSYEEVAEMLSTQGIKISPTSLKSYLSAVQKTDRTKPAKGRRRQASPTPPLTEESSESPPTPTETVSKRRSGRPPKTTTPKPEATLPIAETAPTPRQRGSRSKSAEPTQTAEKRRTRTKSTTAATTDRKPMHLTTGRRKKVV